MSSTTDREKFAGRIKVVAVGGGACRALDRMLDQWPQPPCTVAVDTDDRSLDNSRAAARLPLGARLTNGFGSGGEPRVGKLAVEESVSEWSSICADTDWMIMLTTLGGGTGSGAAPALARVAISCGARVMALAILPFDFEGEERARPARRGLNELHAACDQVVAISNNDLLSATEQQPAAAEAFAAADGAVGFMLAALCRMISGQGLLTLDISSLQNLLSGKTQPAAFAFGRAEGEGEGRAGAALSALLAYPSSDKARSIAGTDSAWIGILAGDGVTFREVETAMVDLRAAMKPEASLLTGVYVDECFGNSFNMVAIIPGAARKQEEQSLASLDVSTPLSQSGRRQLPMEEQLKFEPPQKGRFKDVDPTFVGGEDLDIPTFIRRKIRFEGAR